MLQGRFTVILGFVRTGNSDGKGLTLCTHLDLTYSDRNGSNAAEEFQVPRTRLFQAKLIDQNLNY
jgi:hypothetical protein